MVSRVRGATKDITVTIPTELESEVEVPPAAPEVRESTRVQALLAEVGARMGMQIWIPRNNREAVLGEWKGDHAPLLDRLPLNYDDVTLRTIEQIDVLWTCSGRALVEGQGNQARVRGRANYVRLLWHSTHGRPFGLAAKHGHPLHIVAPAARREKVLQELRRPVFSLLDRGPLSESCSLLSYDSVRELATHSHLSYLPDSVLEEYEEDAAE